MAGSLGLFRVRHWNFAEAGYIFREEFPMSIRLLAKDLYILMRQVRHLEEKIQLTPPMQRTKLEEQLRRRRAERDRVRRMLEATKAR